MKKKFVDACKDGEARLSASIVRQMDNPDNQHHAPGRFHRIACQFRRKCRYGSFAPGGLSLLSRRRPEELVRGARITGFNARSLRNIAAIGNDDYVYNFMENQRGGVAGTALGAFGSGQSGLPAAVVAPSLAVRRS